MKNLILTAALLLSPTIASAELTYPCGYYADYAELFFDSRINGVDEAYIEDSLYDHEDYSTEDLVFQIYMLQEVFKGKYRTSEASKAEGLLLCETVKRERPTW